MSNQPLASAISAMSQSSSRTAVPMSMPTYRTTLVYSAALEKESTGHKAVARIVGSAAAGFLELLVFHPVDTIAKRLMTTKDKYVNTGSFKETRGNLNKIIFRDAVDAGVLRKIGSLFPGLGYATGYKVLQRAYKFGGQPFVNEALNGYSGKWFKSTFGDKTGKSLMSATSGALVGIGEVILLPLDNLKIKAQTNPQALKAAAGGAKGLGGAMAVISSGGMGLYAGAGWTAARNAPGSFALFGGAAVVYNSVFNVDDPRKATFFQMFCASVAGATASIAVAQPLDLLKTRVQARPFDSPERGLKVLTNLIKEEGFTGLFKGLSPKLIVVGPKLIFSFSVAQYLMAYLEQRL